MTINTVKHFVRRMVRGHDDGDILIANDDPISKERIAEMQADIDSKLRKGIKFTPAGPAGW